MSKKLEGVVVSDLVDKTVIVVVERLIKHPKYKKYLKRRKKYKAHDEKNEYKKDERVVIEECKPISKDKHFRVINRV